jgi:hypothetical protein
MGLGYWLFVWLVSTALACAWLAIIRAACRWK